MSFFIPRQAKHEENHTSGAPEIDWLNEANKELEVYLPLNLASHSYLPNLAGLGGEYVDPDVGITNEGLIFRQGSSSNDIAKATKSPPGDEGTFSFILRAYTAQIPSGPTWPYIISTRNSSRIRLTVNLDGEEPSSQKLTMVMQDTGGGTIKAFLPVMPIGEWVTIGGTYDDSGDRKARMWASHTPVSAVSTALGGTLEPYNNEGLYLGNRRAGGRAWKGGISDCWFFSEALPAKVMRELVENPDSLLKPHRKFSTMSSAAATGPNLLLTLVPA